MFLIFYLTGVKFTLVTTCQACPVAPEDGTGVAPEDGTGVEFTSVRACPVEFSVGNPIQQGGRIPLGSSACPVEFTSVTACQVKFMTMTAKRI